MASRSPTAQQGVTAIHPHDPTTRRLSDDRHGERGAILILALAFLTAILITAIALLQMSFTSSASLNNFRTERVLRYSGDAALQSGIDYLRKNPTKALKGSSFVTGTQNTSGTMQIPVIDNPIDGAVKRSVTANSVLILNWEVPADVTTSGEKGDDGGQKPREVLLTVSCRIPSTVGAAHNLQSCATSGGSEKIIARARVRFDIDYGKNARTGAQIPAGERAVVPKIIWWSSKG